ncbi:MAG: DedA family protein [Planctomycetia bacterium]|nr:DedA family protein [Planctomycetia bacterium]
MDTLKQIVDLFLHLDQHLTDVIRDYGLWTYLILFVIVFCETGLVVTPILPGDSLLFAVGALAARPDSPLDMWKLTALLWVAAVLGDAANYAFGHYLGPRVFKENRRFLKRAYLDRTQRFYDRYGGKTIILARFVPIVRTFAPFLAGVGAMSYPRFAVYNVAGATLWVGLFLWGGYYFGGHPFIQKNFEVVALAIVAISLLPVVVEFWRSRAAKKREAAVASGTPHADQ